MLTRFTQILLAFGVSISVVFGQAEMSRVEQIEIDPPSQTDIVLSVLPFRKGEVFDSKLLEISKKLMDATELFERSEVNWDPKSQKISVKAIPKLYFEDLQWKGDGISDRKTIQNLCVEPNEPRPASQERLSKIQRCLLQEVRARGFLDAQVSLEVGETVLIVSLTKGVRYNVRSVEIQGAKRIKLSTLRWNLKNRAERTFQPLAMDEDRKELIKTYMKQGFYFVEVFQPSYDVDSEKHEVVLTFRVNEGPQISLSFVGDYRSNAPLQKFLERDEALPRWFAEQLVDDVEYELKSQGYLNANVTLEKKNLSGGDEEILIRSKRGNQYRLLAPEWVGVNDREQLENIYDDYSEITEGKTFREEIYRKTIQEDFARKLLSLGYLDVRLRGIDFVVDHDKARVRPVISLNEGQIYHIAESQILGFPAESEDSFEYEALRDALTLDRTVDIIELEKFQDAYRRALVSIGYLDAKIERKLDRMESGKVRVTLNVIAGNRYKVARILVRGTVRTDYRVIRREVALSEGGYYEEEKIKETLSQIQRLKIVRTVDVQILEKVSDRSEVYVLVDVKEAARFRFQIGPGYGTLDGVRGVFRGTYANIGGTGRRLELYVKGNRKLEDSHIPADVLDPQEVPFWQRKLILEYFEPRFLNLPLDGRLNLSHSKEDRNRFSIFRYGFSAALDYRWSRQWIFTTSYTLEYSDPFNVRRSQINRQDIDPNQKLLISLGEFVTIAYLDDDFDPKKGYRARISGDIYDQNLKSDVNFWQVENRHTIYYPIYRFTKDKLIGSALSINFGFSAPYGDTVEVPVEKRYFVGGESSVRGYGEKAINPLTRNDYQSLRSGEVFKNYKEGTGGDAYFSFMTEVFFPLFWGVDLLGFFDGGNAFTKNENFKPWDLRYGAGPGIRFNTPFGPFKVGYGFIIARKRINGELEPLGNFYLNVGPL